MFKNRLAARGDGISECSCSMNSSSVRSNRRNSGLRSMAAATGPVLVPAPAIDTVAEATCPGALGICTVTLAGLVPGCAGAVGAVPDVTGGGAWTGAATDGPLVAERFAIMFANPVDSI